MRGTVLRLAVVFVLGIAVGGWINAGPNTLGVATVMAEGQRDGGKTNNSFMGILGRLESVGNTLAAASARLSDINAVLGDPPEPKHEGPAFRSALNFITSQCNAIQETVGELETRAGR